MDGLRGFGFPYANVPDADVAQGGDRPSFDIGPAMFVAAAVTHAIAFASGWLGLRPLLQAFGLDRLAELAAPILAAAALASFAQFAHYLYRSGYGATRVLLAIPLTAIAITMAYGAMVALLGLRSEEATLNLIMTAFILGTIAFALLGFLPIIARHDRPARFLVGHGPCLILALAQAVTVLVGLLVLSVLGLA